MLKESDILFQAGSYWVYKEHFGYQVMRDGTIGAKSVATFPLNSDGLSNAVAYAQYKGSKEVKANG